LIVRDLLLLLCGFSKSNQKMKASKRTARRLAAPKKEVFAVFARVRFVYSAILGKMQNEVVIFNPNRRKIQR